MDIVFLVSHSVVVFFLTAVKQFDPQPSSALCSVFVSVVFVGFENMCFKQDFRFPLYD